MHPATSTSTHLHPSAPSSFQSPPSSIHLHLAQLSLHPALCNILNVIRSLISHISGNFSKFRSKNSNLSILTKNWQQKELGGDGFKSRLSFFLGSRLSLDPKIHFWVNLDQNCQSYQFCLKICAHGIWTMLILIPTLVFWICNPKSIFGLILAKKLKVVHFDWKLVIRVSRGCWFLFCH